MLARFEPRGLWLRPLQGLQGELERVLAGGCGDGCCAVDVHEVDQQFTIQADLPGWSKDDVSITLENGILTIQGQRERKSDTVAGEVHLQERRSGGFRRTFKLPSAVDESKVQAVLKDGVLTVTLDKREEVKPRQIPVRLD